MVKNMLATVKKIYIRVNKETKKGMLLFKNQSRFSRDDFEDYNFYYIKELEVKYDGRKKVMTKEDVLKSLKKNKYIKMEKDNGDMFPGFTILKYDLFINNVDTLREQLLKDNMECFEVFKK